MEYLSNIIIFSSVLSFGCYVVVMGRVEQSRGLETSIFHNFKLSSIIGLIGLIVPPIMLYQDNTFIMTVLKTLGLNFLIVIILLAVNRNNELLSLLSILLFVVTVVSLIIYLFT